MRWPLALILVTFAAGCHRDPHEPPAEPLAAAEPDAPRPDDRRAEAPPAPQPEAAAAARVTDGPAPRVDVVPLPADPVPAGAGAAASAEPEEDDAIYTWTDAQGVAHFGSADEIPDAARRTARKVSGGLTVAEPVPLASPVPTPLAEPAQVAQPLPPDPSSSTREPGEAPELDAQGLPIPGTMKETAHLRAVRQATGVQLDAAAVEREHQKQLRELNCVVKDGVTICG